MILRLVTAAVLIPFFLAIIFWASTWLLILTVDVLIFVGLWEFQRLISKMDFRGSRPAYILVLLMPWIWVYRAESFLLWVLLGVFVIAGWSVFIRKSPREAALSAALNVFGSLYIGIPLSLACDFHPSGMAASWSGVRAGSPVSDGLELLFILVVIWVSDGGAYFGGRLLGRTRIVPEISPGKTLEGFICGLILGMLAALVYGSIYLAPLGWPAGLLLGIGLIITVSGMLGDLFESLLKRGAGLKDSSGIFPGHGGVLDRVDSLLFAFPAYFLVFSLLE